MKHVVHFCYQEEETKAGSFKWPPQSKLFFIMRLTVILILSACLQLSASVYSQQVALDVKNETLQNVFRKIRKQTGYNFLYKNETLTNKGLVSYQLNGELKDVLDQMLGAKNLTYSIMDKTILIKASTTGNRTVAVQDQVSEIKGKVTDERGQPLSGAVIKTNDKATVSDASGNFVLKDVPNDAMLYISYTGFIDQQVSLAGRQQIAIVLKEDLKNLNQVVVVGYGTQKRANLTGAVATIEAEDLASRPIRNINEGLQGQVPGLTVTATSSRPGSNEGAIRIRGVGTLGDAQPLIVIDGIPGGDMSILNPDDVESISVLKDAASSSIYGVRGANGVIVITTKKGKSNADGKPDITYNGYTGIQTPTALPKMVGSVDYMQLMNEAKINGRENPTWTEEQIQLARDGSNPDYYANTNWIDEIYKSSSPQQSHNVSLNGGTTKTSYYLSYGYFNQGGIIAGDNFKANRHNVRLKLATTVFDRLKVDANVGYVDRSSAGAADGVEASRANTSPLAAAMAISPLTSVRFSTGGWGYLGGARNPIAMTTDGGTDVFASQEFTGNIQGTLQLFDGLNFKAQYAQVRYNTRRYVFEKTVNYIDPFGTLVYQSYPVNSFTARSFTSIYQTMLGMLTYDKTFGKHDVKALLAVSQEDNVGNDINASRIKLPSNDVPSLNIGTENQLNSNPASQWALQSFFGRVNYAYDNRYLFEANFRRDGSSRFAPNIRWQWFGSASAGWNFTEENFFKGLKSIINLGKVRASYGSQGNDRVTSLYPYLSTLAPRETMPIGNQLTVGYWQPNVANPYITWETQIKKDIGIDLWMLNNKLSLTADYFVNNTKDILLLVPLPDVWF